MMKQIRPQRGTITTDDGVVLAYYTAGDPESPAVLFANGIGVDVGGATLQLGALAAEAYFITWEYRGVGNSLEGAEAASDLDLSMERHARDGLAVLDALGVERVTFVGWSMGVQVGLELARRAKDRVRGLVALLGASGEPFRGAFSAPVAFALHQAFRLGIRAPWLAQWAVDLAVGLPDVAFWVMSRLKFVGSDAARIVFDSNVRSVARVDKRVYLRTMLALAEHDGGDVLDQLPCPLLVIAADEDTVTPAEVARTMAGRAPRGEFQLIAGTHFALIERVAEVNSALLDFMRRVSGEEAAIGI